MILILNVEENDVREVELKEVEKGQDLDARYADVLMKIWDQDQQHDEVLIKRELKELLEEEIERVKS